MLAQPSLSTAITIVAVGCSSLHVFSMLSLHHVLRHWRPARTLRPGQRSLVGLRPDGLQVDRQRGNLTSPTIPSGRTIGGMRMTTGQTTRKLKMISRLQL